MIKTCQFPGNEEGTVMWIKSACDKNIPPLGPVFRKKQTNLPELGHCEYRASTRRSNKSKSHNGISYKALEW
jgi:hypothetical protein